MSCKLYKIFTQKLCYWFQCVYVLCIASLLCSKYFHNVKSLPLKRFVSVFTSESVPNGNARLLYWKPFFIFITYQSSSGLLLNFRRNSIIKLRGYFLAKHLNYCIIYQQLLIMWIDSIIFSNKEHGFCWKTASQVLWR